MAEAFSSQHTHTFPKFITQTGISLAVSTYQAGKLILLRSKDDVLNTHFVDMPKPMGIALQEPHLAVGTGYQLTHYFNMADAAPKVEPHDTHNACYLPRETHITGDIDIHEMGFTDEGKLWLVNTKMSCLCTLSEEYSVVPQWKPPFISGYDLSDRCHLNGLAMRDGQPHYVTALGTTDTAAGWRENKASGGMIMDIQSNQMIASGLSMPHSPRWYQDQLWVLESGAGSLATVDIDTGKLTTFIELPGFTRGLDFIGRYAVIGLSQVRETAVFAGLPLTKRCDERQCGVYIVDIIEKQVIGFVVFSGDVQEIFSVQILPSSFPAILSLDDPLLASTYSIPDEALQALSKPDPIQDQIKQAFYYSQKGETDKAIAEFKSLLKQSPHNSVALFNLAMIYLSSEKWQKAVDTFKQVIKHESNHAEALNHLGLAYAGLLDWDKATSYYQKAIKIDQQYASAHVNHALVLLRQGKFQAGFEAFEWRWKLPGMKALDCAQSQWQGEDISNKTLLVHTEQTDGDIIQFARFIPLLKKSCKHLIVLCSESFRLFFKGIKGVDEVRLPNQLKTDAFDLYIPLMSLPNILKITRETLPVKTPYWQIPNEVVVPNLADNTHSEKQLKIALYWHDTTSQQKSDSLTLDTILPLTTLKNTTFYSLQTSIEKEEATLLKKNKITNLDIELVSFAHTGALIEQFDLIISVDSPIAHLSASLGKPTWVLLNKNTEWNWMEKGEENPWYPAMHLFRQTQQENRQELISKVNSQLVIEFL